MSVVSFALAVIFIIRLFSTSVFRLPKYNGSFMVYQDRLETYLLQLFAVPKPRNFLSIIVVIFYVNIVAEQKQAVLVTLFCF